MSVNDPACSFFGHFSHNKIIVAPSFGFVNVLLFGTILKGQNAKNEKKAGDEKNLSPDISTVRALEKIIETDLRSYSVGLPFSFFYHFRYQVM